MNPLALSAVLSAAAGASLGMLGGGGSILTVPILLYAAHLGPQSAITVSLLIVGITSAAAAAPHAHMGNVRWKTAGAFGIASMGGAMLGGYLSHYVESALLLAAFTVMMVVTGLAMLRRRPAAATPVIASPSFALPRMAGYGSAVGVLTGLVGAGGGFVIVPALVLLGRLPISAAIGTSLVIIAMNSLVAFAAHLGSTPVDVGMAAILAASSVVGSVAGAITVRRVRPEALRTGFAILVLAIASVMAIRQLRSAGSSGADSGSPGPLSAQGSAPRGG